MLQILIQSLPMYYCTGDFSTLQPFFVLTSLLCMFIFLVSRNKCILCRNVSVWDIWWVNYILLPIPAFFLLCLTWTLMVIIFLCHSWEYVGWDHIWEYFSGIPLKRSWMSWFIFLSLLLSSHCAPRSLGTQKAICVPLCSCYTMAGSTMKAQATQPERQEPVNSFVFFVQMQLWIKIVFLLCFLSRKLTSLCQSGLNYLGEIFFLLTDGPL